MLKSKETKIARIRNLMSPIVSFFEIDKLIRKSKSTKKEQLLFLKKEMEKQSKKNMKKLIKLIKSDWS